MKKMLILLLVATALTFAQAKGPDPMAPGEIVRVIDIKQGQATAIHNNLVGIFPGLSRVGNQLIVRGQPAVVDMIEAAIKKLDVPAPESQPMPNIELTVQLVQGSLKEAADSKVPADLEATVRQLRTLFPYRSYRVVDTQVVRGRSGIRDLSTVGSVAGNTYRFRTQPTVTPGTGPRMVHLTLSFGISQPIVVDGKTQYTDSGITTELDAREGQKTVVGKTNDRSSDDAIFLVITPKVIE